MRQVKLEFTKGVKRVVGVESTKAALPKVRRYFARVSERYSGKGYDTMIETKLAQIEKKLTPGNSLTQLR